MITTLLIFSLTSHKEEKKIVQTIMDIIFEDFLILYQNFFSLQVKRSVIISNKHGLYELSNDLRLRILGN